MDKYQENIKKLESEIKIVEKMREPLLDKYYKISNLETEVGVSKAELRRINLQNENDIELFKQVKNNVIIYKILKCFCIIMMILVLVMSINSIDSSEVWRICYSILGESAIGLSFILCSKDLKNNKEMKNDLLIRMNNYPSEREKAQDKINSLNNELNIVKDKYPNLNQDLSNLNSWLSEANDLINELNDKRLSRIDEIVLSKEGQNLINETYEGVLDLDMPMVRTRKED